MLFILVNWAYWERSNDLSARAAFFYSKGICSRKPTDYKMKFFYNWHICCDHNCLEKQIMKPVEIFHIGPQKTATTWVYRCLREHADIDSPATDAIHYFNIFYHRGRDWYASHFHSQSRQKKRFDPSYSYFRSTVAAQRIYKENTVMHASSVV